MKEIFNETLEDQSNIYEKFNIIYIITCCIIWNNNFYIEYLVTLDFFEVISK